jgi:hypothetical protein
MKTIRHTLIALLGVAAVGGLRAADTNYITTTPKVDVIYSHPEKFTDAGRDQRGSDYGLDENLDELSRYIVNRADAVIPEGEKLTITFTDIDLAGEYEPWRSASRGRDARIVKDIYTPKMDFSFKLTDASGNVVKEGTRHLTNMTFMMDILSPNLRSEPLGHDKQMIGNWLRSEFGGAKKK